MKFNLRPLSQIGPDDSEVLKEIEVGSIVKEALDILNEFEISVDTKNVKNGDHDEGKIHFVDEICEKSQDKESLNGNDGEFRTLKVSKNIDEHVGEKRKRSESEKDDNITFLSPKICKCNGISNDNKEFNGEEINRCILECNCPQLEKTDDKKHPKIVFLGTGSSIPSKYRNVSSILIHTG